MKTDRETRVRERAYALWEESGRPSGTSDQDWLRAERELEASGKPPGTAPSRRPRSATTTKSLTAKPASDAASAAKPAPARKVVAGSAPRVRREGSPPSRGP